LINYTPHIFLEFSIHITPIGLDYTYNAQQSAHYATCNKRKSNKTIQKVVDS